MARSSALVAIIVAACGTKSAPPTSGSLLVTFPSTAAAVATDQVEVMVFDQGDASIGQICPTLVQLRRSAQQLPDALAATSFATPCDFESGQNAVTVPYGTHAVLAIAQRGGADFLIGCALEDVENGSDALPIDLALVSDTTSVPATKCTSLSSHCSGGC